MNRFGLGLSAIVASFIMLLAQAGAQTDTTQSQTEATPVSVREVVVSYTDLAQAAYEDSVRTAQDLKSAIETLLDEPTEENLEEARTAWKVARIPYLQTEVFRLGTPRESEWERRVNGWPLDEGFIDYVDAAYMAQDSDNPYYTANVLAASEIEVAGKIIPLSRITQEVLKDLSAAAEQGNNFPTGYHAIEFLLWGQDDNSPVEPTGDDDFQVGGVRPASDFADEGCTNGNCDRRGEFLFSAVNLLISDLEEMASDWQVTGVSRENMIDDPEAGLATILSGMASLSYGELAGNQLKRALLLGNAEAEQDDFSDYTYAAHLFDARGVVNVYFGEYFAMDNSVTSGASLSDLVVQKDAELDMEMRIKLSVAMVRLRLMVTRARTIENYDQMLLKGNDDGNAVIQATVDSLLDQTQTIKKIARTLGVENLVVAGSDSLDNPDAVL
ncbi:MAG TPA: peptidase [Devosia sp.]|nr:peptidase [Devosia sp.]